MANGTTGKMVWAKRLALLGLLGGLLLASSGAQADPGSAYKSAATYSSTNTSTSVSEDGTEPCPDSDFATTIRDSREAANANAVGAAYSTGSKVVDAFRKDPLKVSDVWNQYCIKGDIKAFFETIIGLLEDLDGTIKALIAMLIENLLEKACEYIAEIITAVMEMICLPLPNISLPNFSLPSLTGQSCDGISLGDFVTVSGGKPLDLTSKLPKSFFSNILTREDIPKDTTIFTLGTDGLKF